MKEEICRAIARRILDFESLLQGNVTPLLQSQLQHAVVAHREVLDHPLSSVDEDLTNLDKLYFEIKSHWKRIYTDMHAAASLFRAMRQLRQFLRSKLLEDYCNERYTVHGLILKLAQLKENAEGCHGKEPDALYQDCVILPLEELMLDRAHVEGKMRTALLREGEPGSDIQPLINKGDWTSLASILVKDRELARKVFPENDQTTQKLMKGIARIADEYYSQLIDASQFTPKAQMDRSSKSPSQSDLAILLEKATPPAEQRVFTGLINGSFGRLKKWVNRYPAGARSQQSNFHQDDLNLKKNE